MPDKRMAVVVALIATSLFLQALGLAEVAHKLHVLSISVWGEDYEQDLENFDQ